MQSFIALEKRMADFSAMRVQIIKYIRTWVTYVACRKEWEWKPKMEIKTQQRRHQIRKTRRPIAQ